MMKINTLTRVFERRRNSLKNVIKKRRPKCPKNKNTRPDLWSEISEKARKLEYNDFEMTWKLQVGPN